MIQLYENLADIPPLPSVLWPVKECVGCDLSPHKGKNPTCKQVVPGTGDLNSEILWVLMNPGNAENEYGHTAIGLTGSKLKDWLRKLGFDPYKFFWANAVACVLPPERTGPRKAAKLEQDEIDACHVNLSLIIENMPNLRLVVCVGGEAIRAIEGKKQKISDRVSNLARFTWHPTYFHQKEKRLLSYALYHPSFIVRQGNKQDEFVREQSELIYQWQLKFLQQIILNLDDIESLKPSGETIICESEEQAFAWADQQLKDNRINAYVVDFETLGSNAWYSEAMCVAFAYLDPDKKQVVSFVVPFLQCIDLPKEVWYKTRLKKTLSRFEMKWSWTDWFSTGFSKRFMDKLRPLFDVTVPLPEGRDKPMLGAYHMGFDRNCWKGSFGWVPCGSERQFTESDHNEVMPYDFMPTFRICGSQNSMKLENILKIIMPLIADEKNIVDTVLTKTQKDATGFGLLARKLPEQYNKEEVRKWAETYKEYLGSIGHERKKKVKKELRNKAPLTDEQIHVVDTYYSLQADGFLSDILFGRAGFDGKKEHDLWEIANQILSSDDENALFLIAKERDFDELFLGEQFEEVLTQMSDPDLVCQL